MTVAVTRVTVPVIDAPVRVSPATTIWQPFTRKKHAGSIVATSPSMIEIPMTLAFFYVEAFAIFVVASALAASIELNQLQERGVVPRLGGLQGARVLASFAPSVRNASTRI